MLNNKTNFRPLIYAAMIMLISTNAFALKMGAMQVRSHLGEPLDVLILLSELNAINLSEISIKLATADQYAENNLEYLDDANKIKITISPFNSELAVVSVKTLDTISEKPIHLLFDVQGGDESLLSRYTVTLGQPVVSIPGVLTEPVLTQFATDSAGLNNDTSAHKVSDLLNNKTYRVKEAETFSAIVKKFRPAKMDEQDEAQNEHRTRSDQQLSLEAQLEKIANRFSRQAIYSANLEKKAVAFQGQVERLNREQETYKSNAQASALVAQNRVALAEEKMAKMVEEMANLRASSESNAQASALAAQNRVALAEEKTAKMAKEMANLRASSDQQSLKLNAKNKNSLQIDKNPVDSKNEITKEKVKLLTIDEAENIIPVTSKADIIDSLPPVEKDIEPDSNTGNGRLWGVLGAILLGILLMLVLLRLRKSNKNKVKATKDSALKGATRTGVANNMDIELVSSNAMYEDESVITSATNDSSARTTSANVDLKSKKKITVHQDSSPELNATFSRRQVSSSDEVLAEAEVYLAYNRVSRAVNVLDRCLNVSPNQAVVAHKLLGIYKDHDDKDSFRLLFDESVKYFSKDKKWNEAKQLAEAFIPEHPFFSNED